VQDALRRLEANLIQVVTEFCTDIEPLGDKGFHGFCCVARTL